MADDNPIVNTGKEKALYKDLAEKGVNNKLQHQQSLQHNRQDMDQTQEVDVKPSQVNVQTIDLTINNKLENYSGRITGSILREANGQIVPEANIYLFFGSVTDFPVCRIKSDADGNYCLEDLPPGFYTILVRAGDLQGLARNVKILPGATCDQCIALMPRSSYSNYSTK